MVILPDDGIWNEEQCKEWERIVKIGKRNYLIRYWLLLRGLFMFTLISSVILVLGPSLAALIQYLAIITLISVITSLFAGHLRWQQLTRSYNHHKKHFLKADL